jgi:ubiquinone/menaquinone biosynthesis C-methylase UbiE
MAQVFLKSAKGGTILDVSCGGGGFTRRFLISGDYETVIASDYSEAMLENCRGFLEKDSAVDSKKVVLIRADVARLPFATSSLAAVHAGAAIHCWPQPTTSVSFLDLSKRMYTHRFAYHNLMHHA